MSYRNDEDLNVYDDLTNVLWSGYQDGVSVDVTNYYRQPAGMLSNNERDIDNLGAQQYQVSDTQSETP
ncbi:hypothetical protein QQS21_008192 [Conoideocrella luteorostrata]|uniref:Uncharacterized protein n=1 Tax=Conoideocrella luteorostrata TaxID=1105319 RepID=A0AAJ0FW81_9HYPO|nr:hypothetical protein QQS21_008192 [Conoideocrella luteorostrata]